MSSVLLRRRGDGAAFALPVAAWHSPATEAETRLLGALAGPVLDLGCGPGRLLVALGELGTPALGVDSSPVAASFARARGAAVVNRCLFERLPGEGRWWSVLLFDGNVGIGGDPVRLFRRVGSLLAPGGRVVVELDGPGRAGAITKARLENLDGPKCATGWFPWAWVGVDGFDQVAVAAGLWPTGSFGSTGRWFGVAQR